MEQIIKGFLTKCFKWIKTKAENHKQSIHFIYTCQGQLYDDLKIYALSRNQETNWFMCEDYSK